jgi:hypothetical protein
MLLRLLLVVGVLLVIIHFTGVLQQPRNKETQQAVKRSEQVKKELELSVDQYQQKLDDAMKESGATQ